MVIYKSLTLCCRDNSLEVQADVEAKPQKLRHHSGSSSLDEASCSSTAGLMGGSRGACCCAQHEGHGASCAGKSGKGKMWKKGGGKGERNTDAQLVEQRSTNSSEFDSPSLSGSLPSVADSHCSHFSSELSCSEPETSRPPPPPPPCHAVTEQHEAAVTPMPEVEHDRPELRLPRGSHAALARSLSCASSPPASPREGSSSSSSGMFLHISEEGAGGLASTEPEREEENAGKPECSTRGRCIQTEI